MIYFARLLADLWNKIKRDSPQSAACLSEGDIVIFVVGPTGSGKSWFIKEATQSKSIESSRDYHPFTTKVQAIRCDLTDEAKADLKAEGIKSIVFVDTPSFHTGYDDLDVQKEINTWVDRIDLRKPRYLGMIYMHRIETNPALEPIEIHIQEFVTLSRLRDNHPLRLHIVVSYDMTSANISESNIKDRRYTLCEQMKKLSSSKWQSSMHPGYFQGEPEVAWRAVEELLGTTDTVACDTRS